MKKGFITLVKILIFFFGWAVLSGVIDIPNDNPAIWRFFAELIPLVVIIIFTVLFVIIEKKEVKIPIAENCVKGTLTGTIVGMIWLGLSVIILIMFHQLQIVGKNNVPLLWLWVLSAFINVIMQELLIRGYLYQLLKTKYNLTWAVIVTTSLFTFFHGGAFEAGLIPVLNVITMCMFTTVMYESEKTVLAPIMAHSVWNIVGAIILGGISLADDYPSLYFMTATGNEVLSGGDYKIEASIVVMVINIVLLIIFMLRYKKLQTKRINDSNLRQHRTKTT